MSQFYWRAQGHLKDDSHAFMGSLIERMQVKLNDAKFRFADGLREEVLEILYGLAGEIIEEQCYFEYLQTDGDTDMIRLRLQHIFDRLNCSEPVTLKKSCFDTPVAVNEF